MKQTAFSSAKFRRIALIALFGALSYVLMLVIHFKISFLTLDLKDTIIALSGLYFGPLAALTLSLLVPLLEFITVSDTGVYGLLMNFLGSAAFSVTAAVIYRYKKSFAGALIALFSAVAALVAVMLTFNLLVTPHYMGVTVAEVQALIPTLLLPFNLIKAILNMGFVLLFYKPISTVMQRMGLIEKSTRPQGFHRRSVVMILIALALIAVSFAVIFGILGGRLG